jgi:hypothetical protein
MNRVPRAGGRSRGFEIVGGNDQFLFPRSLQWLRLRAGNAGVRLGAQSQVLSKEPG